MQREMKKLRKKVREIEDLERSPVKLRAEELKKVEDKDKYEERIAAIQASLDAVAQGLTVSIHI